MKAVYYILLKLFLTGSEYFLNVKNQLILKLFFMNLHVQLVTIFRFQLNLLLVLFIPKKGYR